MMDTNSLMAATLTLALLGAGCSPAKFDTSSGGPQELTIEVDDQSSVAEGGTTPRSIDTMGKKASSLSTETSSRELLTDDAQSCAQTFQASPGLVRLAGALHKVSLRVDEMVLSRITGNQNQMEVHVEGKASGQKVAGICLFLAGHENQVTVQVKHPVQGIFIRARGDQPKVMITIAPEITVDTIRWDAQGHEPQLEIKGDRGAYPCPSNAKKGSVSCQ